MIVNFEGRQVEYDFGDLDELGRWRMCCRSTRARGREFPCVVIPLHTQHYMMLRRNLLYTAVTRGKRLVVLVGTKKALAMAVRRPDTGRRYTAVRKRLQEGTVAGSLGCLGVSLGWRIRPKIGSDHADSRWKSKENGAMRKPPKEIETRWLSNQPPGLVVPEALYTIEEVKARLRMANKSWSQFRRAGAKAIRFGRRELSWAAK